ncbi:unnamed protein product [Amaranthus hypochondriacus]
MASQAVHLLVFLLACSFLISSNSIPMSRLSNLPNKGSIEIVGTEIMNDQNHKISKERMEEQFIEGRMDIEKNDYGPTTSNPVHTPRPPRS